MAGEVHILSLGGVLEDPRKDERKTTVTLGIPTTAKAINRNDLGLF